MSEPIKTLQKLKMMNGDGSLGVDFPHYSQLVMPHHGSTDFQFIAEMNGKLNAIIEHLSEEDA